MLKNPSKILFALLLMLSLSACWKNDLKKYYGREGMMTMRPAHLGEMPQGDDSYSQGIRDGCNTAIAVIGAGPMASQYESTYYDVDRSIKDKEYSKGYELGFNYCTYYQDVDPL